jgi:D-alanyl-D-alanine carboxypeptidase/D-alanyl-D-alanine-endopeptidase (penicillin-binding protein 4)
MRGMMMRMVAGALCSLAALAALAQAQGLPPEVQTALRKAHVPESALSVNVEEVGGGARRLAWQERRPVNPASVFKLFTTYAALDQLGPAWRWHTPVLLSGPVHDGVLDGSVVIRGTGDPQFVLERVWLMLRRLQQLGVHQIKGDIWLDGSAIVLPAGTAADFDGDPTRPYNVRPDALLLNYKSITLSFTPDPARGVATVAMEPALSGVGLDKTVPLRAGGCEDWRAALKAQLDDPRRLGFAGDYPVACGEKSWPVAYADPTSYNTRLIDGMWRELGGVLNGQVREGVGPADLRTVIDITSPSLSEVVHDTNKFSNNVMAEQLFLTLARQARPDVPADPAGGRQALQQWMHARWSDANLQGTVIDNGSGLSRDTRVSALLISQLLQEAWASPVMAELMGSLPISGLDGTLRRSKASVGRAHLKTGSLRDVAAVAGYVLGDSGKRYVLVAVLNHPDANAARPALDALVQWTIDDTRRP